MTDWFASWRLACVQEQLADTRASLRALVTYLHKHGGYMSAKWQAELRRAERVLAEP